MDVEAIEQAVRELEDDQQSFTKSIAQTIKNLTWKPSFRFFNKVANTIRRINPMAGPDKIPAGSWGGDLDPMNQTRRAQFEASLEGQTKQLQQLHQQAAAQAASRPRPPIQVIDQMPPAQGPDAFAMTIPSAGNEGGGDLIGAMGEDLARSEREMAKARAASGEGPFIPEDPIPAPPGQAPRAVGHIPKSLRAKMAAQQAAAPPPPVVPPPAAPQRIASPQAHQQHQSALARKRAGQKQVVIGGLIEAMERAREQVEAGSVRIEEVLDLLSAASELQYSIAAHLKGE